MSQSTLDAIQKHWAVGTLGFSFWFLFEARIGRLFLLLCLDAGRSPAKSRYSRYVLKWIPLGDYSGRRSKTPWNSPYGNWGRHSIDTPPDWDPRATALPQPWHVQLTEIYSPLVLFWRSWTRGHHKVKSPGYVEGSSSTSKSTNRVWTLRDMRMGAVAQRGEPAMSTTGWFGRVLGGYIKALCF